jgi:hypothetical protein
MNAYIHAYVHTYIPNTYIQYIHTFIQKYIHTYGELDAIMCARVFMCFRVQSGVGNRVGLNHE